MSEPSETISVEISDTQAWIGIDRGYLAGITRRVLRLHGIESATISLAIVDDAAIRRVHADHLDEDSPTDVITFDLSEPGSDSLIADLVLSAETAVRVALAESIPPLNELILYLVHGLLHLCGQDDLDEDSRSRMRGREREVMAELDLKHPGAGR